MSKQSDLLEMAKVQVADLPLQPTPSVDEVLKEFLSDWHIMNEVFTSHAPEYRLPYSSLWRAHREEVEERVRFYFSKLMWKEGKELFAYVIYWFTEARVAIIADALKMPSNQIAKLMGTVTVKDAHCPRCFAKFERTFNNRSDHRRFVDSGVYYFCLCDECKKIEVFANLYINSTDDRPTPAK